MLVDDSHVRLAQGLVKELVGDLTLRAKAVEQSLSSRTRFLPTIGRPGELAAVEAAKAELAQATSAMESLAVLRGLVEAPLMAEVDAYVRTVSEPYNRGVAALRNLEAWPGMVDRLAASLAGLLHALGQARNMASSGYNWQTRTFSPQATELINQAMAAAQQLDAETDLVNGLADRHHLAVAGTPHAASALPRVPVVGFRVRIERVLTLNISDVQAEFNRVLEMCGMLEGVGVAGLRESMGGMTERHRELGRAYLEAYLKQLRSYMDEHRFSPDQLTRRIRDLQARYLQETNFPFELDA